MTDLEERFSQRVGALDRFIDKIAALGGYDTRGGVEESGFLPKLRTIVDPSGSAEFSSHPRDMTTQVAWFSYLFIAQTDGLERPGGFAPKSIIAEAVDGPYVTNAVRVSL